MTGIDPAPMPDHLFGFQAACVDFLLRCGSGGLYLDTGLGKTACELEWSRQAGDATNGRSLILTPLAVAQQIAREGERWNYDIRVIRDQSEAREGINVCNYDRLDKLDPDAFGAVCLDESGILKNFSGKTSRALIDAFSGHRFKLSSTATPAPNDHMELGQQAEFCGVMSGNEMLSRFFINDASKASQEWRLKSHGVDQFWDWMASWCRMAQMPSDLGFPDDGFDLPELIVSKHKAAGSNIKGEGLFADIEMSATQMHAVKRQTSDARSRLVADLVAGEPGEPWVIWCDTDYEADALKALIPQAIEVRGSMTADQKEQNIAAFGDGSALVLITKPSVCGFGLNWQHCARTVFMGRSFSYEAWYQAVRRFWRFGQKRQVHVHLAVAEGEDAIGRVINRKAGDHADMKRAMAAAMKRAMGQSSATKVPYNPTFQGRLPRWLKSVA